MKERLRQALADLYARVPLGMRLGLGPMQEACRKADHPEGAFEAVHIAGTNGKGSVCAMVEAMARAHGLRTGMYTSPHLCRFAERIRIDGEPIADELLEPLLRQAVDGAPDLSFFETATLAAFLAFREAKVDLAVLEVGIGGRLDATNVIARPRACAITTIGLDHTDRLGATAVEIAREKAGIAKTGSPLFLGPMTADVRRAIDEVAETQGVRSLSITDVSPRISLPSRMNLHGAHQEDNARVAYLVGQAIGARDEACRRGLASASWPGRLEVIETPRGPVLLDAAHNPDGIDALARALKLPHVNRGARPPTTALVFGALADKDWASMLARIAPLSMHRVYVCPQGRAPTPPTMLAERASGAIAPNVREALALARRAVGTAGLVVVCGSIFLVGEARAELLGLERDPLVAL